MTLPASHSRTRVGAYIRTRRTAARLTIRAVAAAIGVSEVYLGDVERGRRTMTLERLLQLEQNVPGFSALDASRLTSEGRPTPYPVQDSDACDFLGRVGDGIASHSLTSNEVLRMAEYLGRFAAMARPCGALTREALGSIARASYLLEALAHAGHADRPRPVTKAPRAEGEGRRAKGEGRRGSPAASAGLAGTPAEPDALTVFDAVASSPAMRGVRASDWLAELADDDATPVPSPTKAGKGESR